MENGTHSGIEKKAANFRRLLAHILFHMGTAYRNIYRVLSKEAVDFTFAMATLLLRTTKIKFHHKK